MIIRCGFLRRYIPLAQSDAWIAEAFIHLGFEVEQITHCGYCGNGPLVVGQVLEKNPHPQADRLSVCKVDVGQASPLQIVCGAQNFKVGDIVPVALVGAKLGDRVMEKASLRGIDSYGMMCSADELGLAETRCHGLLILNDRNPKIGTPLEELFGSTRDTLLDLSIPSNRGDCLSYVGLARELSALSGVPVQETPDLGIASDNPFKAHLADPKAFLHQLPQQAWITLDADRCDYFSGCCIENITVQPSPEPIQSFLLASGLHPINNLVDVTNVILLEQGQPLHAFDVDKVQGNLCVRLAQPNESLGLLTGTTQALTTQTMVVADDQQALSIAGVMGGESSSITEQTKRIFIECAHFDRASIRNTSQALHLSSDSSYRFERFVDKERAALALVRAIQLLSLTNPGLSIKFFTEAGQDHDEAQTLTVRLSKITSVLGAPVDGSAFQDMLKRFQFTIESINGDVLTVRIPSYRPDITQEVDMAEEWIRLQGTDALPTRLTSESVCILQDDPIHTLRKHHADLLTHAGFYECYTDTLQPVQWYAESLSEAQHKALNLEKPLSVDHACLRYSLIPGLVQALFDNRRYGNPTERLFETGHIFKTNRQGSVCEVFATAFVFMPSKKRLWNPVAPFDFYAAKTLAQNLVSASGHPFPIVSSDTPTLWQSKYSCRFGNWEQQGVEIAIGNLDLDFTKNWFKDDVVLAAECLWRIDRLRPTVRKTFQAYYDGSLVTKDLALWVPTETLCDTVRRDLIKAVKKCIKNPIVLHNLEVFDVFQDPQNNRKSLAFSLQFGTNGSALTDAQVQSVFDALQEQIEQSTSYRIRKLN